MKRFTTIPFLTFLFAVFLLSSGPTAIFAESNPNIIQSVVNTANTDQQVSKQNNDVQLKIEDKNTEKNQLRATILNAKKVEGVWTYYFNGVKQDSKEHNETSFNIPLKYTFGDDEVDVKVDFKGKVDGKKVNLTDNFEIFGLKVTYDNSIKGKDRFKIKVTNIEKSNGTWKVKVEDEKGKMVGKFTKKNVNGLTFSHAFSDFKNGTYKVTFSFDGKMHDYDEQIKFDYSKEFQINNGTPQTPGEDNNDQTTEPDTGISNSETTKPQPTASIDTNKTVTTGGTLPKTATSYPIMIVAGAVLLLVGVVMYRRNRSS
jgi:LPXTG-motif cell wall-anchored protein